MLVGIPLEEGSDRKLSGDPNKKQIKAAMINMVSPTVVRIFYLLSLGVINLVHPKGSLALPSTCLAYSLRCCTPEACLISRDTTTSLQRSHSACKQTLLVALFKLEGNNVVDLAKLKQAEAEILRAPGQMAQMEAGHSVPLYL